MTLRNMLRAKLPAFTGVRASSPSPRGAAQKRTPPMAGSGHGLPLRLRWHDDRCTQDRCQVAATLESAQSGHKLPFRRRNPVAMPDSITIARRIRGADDFDGTQNAPALRHRGLA